MSNKALILCATIFSLLLLEFGVFVLEKTGVVDFEEPSYSLKQIVPFWLDISPDFGVWHSPNASYRYKKSCFNVAYTSNSFGARDSEREIKADKPRAIIVGDSFVEGTGVEQGERFTDLLEQQTYLEHLNFGTGGSFGPTQYWLLYKTLAKKFDHDILIVGILPDNDFLDDDYGFAKKRYKNKYRPYWVGEPPNLNLVHFPESINSNYLVLAWKYSKGFLREFSYGYRGMEYLFDVISYKQEALKQQKGSGKSARHGYSGYYDFTERQWQIMAHNLSLLAAEAKGKRILFVTFPRHGDFIRHKEEGSEPPLPPRLEKLAEQLGASYVDLMPTMEVDPDWESYFLSCDRHWSKKGHATAATIIQASEPYRAWLASGNLTNNKTK